MKSFSKIALVALLAATLAAEPLAAAGVHPVTGETLADDQTFRYRISSEPSSLDPQLVDGVNGAEIVRDLFEGLLNQDADGNWVPGVATHFAANDDNSVFTFYLRSDARWSDGRPVTARDFVYAWRRAANPATASPYVWFIEIMALKGAAEVVSGNAPVETLGVKAINDTTLEVTLSGSVPYFPMMTTNVTTFPAPRWAIEKHGSAWTAPENIVSNGAYILTEHIVGKRSTRLRNLMYWNDAASIIDKTVTYVIDDDNAAFQYFTANQLDRTDVPIGQYPEIKAANPNETLSFPRLCSYYYGFNLSETGLPAFRDVRVRKALSYAIDRDLIINNILRGGQFAAYTFTPSATANFLVPNVEYAEMTQAERDSQARQLLSDAGYNSNNPLSFSLLFNTSESHKKIATAISEMWRKKLGVNVDILHLSWREFLEVRGRQRFDIARMGWCGDYNEASSFLDLVTTASPYNDSRYSNVEIDELMASSKTTNQPYAYYSEVEQILADEMPIIPIYHYAGLIMLSSAVKNWPVKNAEQKWYSRNLYKVKE